MVLDAISKDLAPGAADRRRLADAALRCAAGCWFAVTLLGQWLFMYYIAALYGPSSLTGHFERWRIKATLIKGYVRGDTAGNLSFAAHVLLAAIVAFGGLLQLIPQLRGRARWVHRWNGRVFLVAAAGASAVGLYMVWVRGARYDPVNTIAVTGNAILNLALVAIAWRAARLGDLAAHRRWALRAFMAINGVFFIRIGVAAWFALFGAWTGKTMGPLVFAGFEFGSYLIPLAVLELYLRARSSPSARARLATAALLVAITAYSLTGTLAATIARREILM
jgi:uncharacterized membrane protein